MFGLILVGVVTGSSEMLVLCVLIVEVGNDDNV